jgi:glucose dehydrogenase
MRPIRAGALPIFIASLVLAGSAQQTGKAGAGDWPTYNHDLAGTRFSPLTQITPENVSKLTQVWSYDRASVDGPGPFHAFTASIKDASGKTIAILPCQRRPWARLIAVNANTGEIAWQTTLGIAEQLPAGKQDTGGSGSAGPTATAGGVVFIGATDDKRFRAFDSKSGKELWVATLGAVASANPITYQGKNGKQYVAIVASDDVVVFGLN